MEESQKNLWTVILSVGTLIIGVLTYITLREKNLVEIDEHEKKRIIERKRHISEREMQLKDSLYSLRVINNTTEAVEIAISYKSLDGLWVNVGWWEIKPQDSSNTNMSTLQPTFYYFARSRTKVWDGKNAPDSYEDEISNDPFEFIEGFTNNQDKVWAVFRGVNIKDSCKGYCTYALRLD